MSFIRPREDDTMNRWTSMTGALLIAFAATSTYAAPPGAMIASALAAAPRAVASGASVMTGDGKMLRKGSNGWTCMPDNPVTPGPDAMCFDKAGMAWAMAWMGHKQPPATTGFAYMLAGGTDFSNTDPYSTKPTAGWVRTGPHLMILSAEAAASSGYPSGQTHPDTSKPYVMFGGTPYAHIMMPVR
jgi:hypothetical protein